MGLFEKLGMVEETNDIDVNVQDIMEQEFSNEDNCSNENVETQTFEETLILPEEIYNTAGYQNENSIFKIEEFKNALPKEMTQEMMKQSVIGVLNACNLTVEELLEDGEKRINILEQNIHSLNEETNEYINIIKNEIEELTKQIEKNKSDINNKNMFTDSQIKILTEEINKINEIINFIK